jgi:hypothetical protein
MFIPGRPFQPSLMFLGKVRSLPQSGATLGASHGQAPALLANIRLGEKYLPGAYPKVEHLKGVITWVSSCSQTLDKAGKNLPGTNTLAYYEHE